MAGCRKRHSKLQQAHYKAYALENRAVVNRTKRLKKVLKNSPNNLLQIEAAIQKAHFRKQKPKQSILTNDTKTRLHIVKFFTGKGTKELISAQKEQHAKAWEGLLSTKRNGKIPHDIARLRIMSIGENLPDGTKKQLEIFKVNLKAA